MKKVLLTLLLFCGTLHADEFRAGVGRACITPQAPIWMSGYASRSHPSEGVVHDLWARALAMEDDQRGRVVIVTTDLLGLPREITDEVASRVAKKHGIERAQLLFSSAHTHGGPAVWPNLRIMFTIGPEDERRVAEYAAKLTDDLAGVVAAALGDLAPARIDCGHGSAGFAMNRRESTPNGVRLGVNPQGPVDNDVPVVRVTTPEGKLRAVLFGYACHNTTLGGDFYRIHGDYAGFAEIELEKAHPGAAAMFMILCGADQNPNPRGTLEMAERHGKSLAQEVDRVLAGELRRVRPPIRAAYQVVQLDFAHHDRGMFEAEATSPNRFKQRRAEAMLKAYDSGRPVRRTPYPVQAVRFDDTLALVALGGEVVVDYSLSLKREFPGENLVVAGYCNDVMCYIPSLRVLRGGGYEPVDSMIYYGQPGPFAQYVEQDVLAACRQVLCRAGAKGRP
jgi:neutral ceramidase